MVSVTREKYLESIQKLHDTAAGLGQRLSMTQLTWQPQDGERWSVLECLDHLTIFNEAYLASLETAAANAGPGKHAGEFRTAGFLSEKFITMAEPPVSMKIRAPGKIQPRPTLKPEKILPDFLKTLDRISHFVKFTANKDLSKVRFKNPFIPVVRFTAGTGMLTLGAHTRRHLWQAEQNLKEPDFPG